MVQCTNCECLLNKLNFVSIHVPVVRQHCAQIEGFAFSHINNNSIYAIVSFIDLYDLL